MFKDKICKCIKCTNTSKSSFYLAAVEVITVLPWVSLTMKEESKIHCCVWLWWRAQRRGVAQFCVWCNPSVTWIPRRTPTPIHTYTHTPRQLLQDLHRICQHAMRQHTICSSTIICCTICRAWNKTASWKTVLICFYDINLICLRRAPNWQ